VSHVVFTTEAGAAAYQARVDKLLGYPSLDATHVGGGRHVELDPSTPGPGWTVHHGEVRAHPKDKRWAHPAVDPDVVPGKGTASAADIASLKADLAKAEKLGKDWTSTSTTVEPRAGERVYP
jgi:hypothetical protein